MCCAIGANWTSAAPMSVARTGALSPFWLFKQRLERDVIVRQICWLGSGRGTSLGRGPSCRRRSGIFTSAAPTRAYELHVGCVYLQRMPLITVAIGVLFNAQATFDVDGAATLQVLRSRFRLPSP